MDRLNMEKNTKFVENETGFTCTSCKTKHLFSAYVYAHTSQELVHTCTCGKKHVIVDRNAAAIEN